MKPHSVPTLIYHLPMEDRRSPICRDSNQSKATSLQHASLLSTILQFSFIKVKKVRSCLNWSLITVIKIKKSRKNFSKFLDQQVFFKFEFHALFSCIFSTEKKHGQVQFIKKSDLKKIVQKSIVFPSSSKKITYTLHRV